MPKTPQTPGGRIETIIDSLNARWDLGLPRFDGVGAEQADETDPLSKRCFQRIQFLCYKTDNIDTLISDFEETARKIHSKWVFKPLQTPGTLPVLPQTKSLIEREFMIRRRDGMIQLSDQQRTQLLKLLSELLEEPCELARLTASFKTERVSNSATSFATAATTAPITPPRRTLSRKQERYSTASHNVLKISEVVKAESNEPQLKNPATRSAKRTLGSPNAHNKRQQTTLSQFLIPVAQQPPLPPPTMTPAQGSFETVPSPAISAVFSSAGEEDFGNASNATSILSTPAEASQDLFPTQDADMYLEDEVIRRSINESFTSRAAFDPTDLVQKTPFKRQAVLPPGLPFWYCWEIHRIGPLLDLLPLELNQQIQRKYGKDNISYAEFCAGVKQVCSEKQISNVPQRSGIPEWALAEDRYEDEETNKVVYFTAALDWENDLSKGLLKFRLNNLHLEQSCRFSRKFGADRFLVISAPIFSDPPTSKIKRLDKDKNIPLHRKITDFLASGLHFIAGRYWRICNVEEVQSKPRRKKEIPKKEVPKRVKITMFAQSGYGVSDPPMELKNLDMKTKRLYPEVTIGDLVQWHMPIHANMKSTDLKLFSRIGLGFSKTKSTVKLHQHEFLERPDTPMDDGCALMSYPLAEAIWAAYGGKGEVPSAVQGRISGAKGLWIVDYQRRFGEVSDRGYWIQVSYSQLKIHPHPRHRPDADDSQRSFEVLKFWGDCKEGHLNKQLVTILEDRGVPRALLRKTLESDLGEFSESLSKAMADPIALRKWMQEHGFGSRSSVTKVLGSFPSGNQDQMKLLLESGFHPEACDKLWSTAYDLLSSHMSDYLDKMKIRLPHSTVVFCAPDPCGVLAENEVFLSFSKPITDPRTSLSESELDNINILLARNPAYLASDMQLRRAVYKRELRHYKNVILFSIKGNVSTASLLSGGDYDGDTVTCIWDPKFIEHFQNVNMPNVPSEESCKLQQKSRPLSDIFGPGRPIEEAMTEFLCGCLSFNARANQLGMCSSEHEKLVYSLSLKQEREKLSNSGAITLATLAGYLVDSNKQGWYLDQEAWHRLRRKASGDIQLPEPAYKDNDPPRKSSNGCLNVLDFLKFDVAKDLIDQAKEAFESRRSNVGRYDKALSRYWLDAKHMMKQETEDLISRTRVSYNLRPASPPSMKLSDLLEGDGGLRGEILDVKTRWDSGAVPNAVSSFGGETREVKDFELRVQQLYDLYNAIEPQKMHHELHREHDRDTRLGNAIPYWSLLKASCLYATVRGTGKLPDWAWYLAGRELCILKCLQNKEVKVMTPEMHEILKLDAKHTKSVLERIAEQEVLVKEVDEELVDDDDDDTVALD